MLEILELVLGLLGFKFKCAWSQRQCSYTHKIKHIILLWKKHIIKGMFYTHKNVLFFFCCPRETPLFFYDFSNKNTFRSISVVIYSSSRCFVVKDFSHCMMCYLSVSGVSFSSSRHSWSTQIFNTYLQYPKHFWRVDFTFVVGGGMEI